MHHKLFRDSRFSTARSTVSKERSSFDLSHDHKLTMNAGELVPFYIQEVLPGDTFSFSDAFVCRTSSPPVAPVMDTSLLDQWLFFVPWRLVWDHTREFFGENRDSAWEQEQEYYIPKYRPEGGFKLGGLGDYFGIPLVSGKPVNALPFRSYRLIWNELYRDQNTQDPVFIDFGDNLATDPSFDVVLPVNKRKDYFTTALPSPQKGPDVLLPLTGFVPVVTREAEGNPGSLNTIPLYWNLPDQATFPDGEMYVFGGRGADSHILTTGVYSSSEIDQNSMLDNGIPSNLWANMSAAQAGATINQLRQAFAVQALYELDARGGSRYREFLRSHFGVSVPDLTVQVPEFLAGMSTPINVSQVVQTSATGIGETAQGNVSAFSKTVSRNSSQFSKSFSEPGFIIGVCAIRTLQSYQQGLNRMWSRSSRLDVYHPILGHIGEQPIFNKEIYTTSDSGTYDDQVFGYQEPWAEYRYCQNYISGYFRSGVDGSLDYWHYANDFDSLPYLSDGFVRETSANIARTLSYTDTTHTNQFLLDFWFDVTATRVMSAYGTPAILGRQ